MDPKNPKKISYMCLDHIKEYNKNLNYYANMTADQIEAEIRADTIWRKPTWPLRGDHIHLRTKKDFFGFFEDGSEKTSQNGKQEKTFPKDVASALHVLGVDLPVTLEKLKKTYKKSVKECHPDLHPGKKDREEHLKKINIAYKIVLEFLQNAS